MCQGRVTMSSICPRLNTVDVQRKIELTNTALKNLCDTHSCRFLNNDNFFKLADKTVNDSLLMRDRVHLTWQPSNKLALNLKLKTTEKCVSLYRSRGRPRQTRYASNYRRSDVNQTRPTEREYNRLKHSQKDERQNHYYRHDSYHHRSSQNREDHQILRQRHQQKVTHIIPEKINTDMTPTLVKTLDMTPITVNVTTAGNLNVNATENYRRKKEIRT